MTKDFNVKITVRSGRLLDAIREGHPSVAAFCRATNIPKSNVGMLVCMRIKPIGKNGEWKDMARDIAAALGKYPEEIWPEHMREIQAIRSTAEMSANMSEVQALSDQNSVEARRLLERWSSKINPRWARIIHQRANGMKLEEIGKAEGVSRERIRGIVFQGQRAMRKKALTDGVRSMRDIDGILEAESIAPVELREP